MGAKPFIKDRGEIGLPIIAGALVLFGMVMIYSASGVLAGHRMGDSAYFLKRQLLWTLIALPLAVAASRIDYQRWKGWLAALALFVLLLLLAVLLPGVGREVNGSRRWLPVLGLTVQPSEFAKLFVVIYTAHYLSRKEGIFPPLAVSGLAAVLIMIEPDFGTTVSLLMVVGLLLFVGGAPIRHLATLALVGFPMLATWALSSPYRRERLLTFLDPWQDPTRHGFQIIQSYLALGGGGALGLGLGEGRQKLFYLPEPHTDFIFAVAGEELGLLGTTILL
ncbi:MAG TPA: FtsW/RodA/SpoVE family cell cycle protein, partial [Nitrospiria bacterium]|nr:FtsW/RodA/SpoVE family cell cycle protein [Nitrospiria bacterium]